MKELKEKAQAFIDKYSPELAAKGLKILLSKRYFDFILLCFGFGKSFYSLVD
ncbi:MAG: hypothetical protein IKB41_03305 [Clostridia bacterium]|nr:hypothetical protein [Clostridia bacterium]